MRNFKILGLAMMALLAMSAVTASAATAEEKFHSDVEKTTLTATSEANHSFQAAGSTITCTHAGFSGSQAAATTDSVTVTGSYSGCTYFGVPVSVNMGDCEYVFHADGSVDIASVASGNCATKPITFRAHFTVFFTFECHVAVGPQTGLQSVSYTGITDSGKEAITLGANVQNIKYTSKGNGCSKTGTHEDGVYSPGNTIVVGEEEGTSNRVNIWNTTT